MWADEVVVAQAGEQVLSSPTFVPFVDINYGHPTPLLYLEGLSIRFLGKTLTTIRLSSIVFGALDIVIFYLFLRLFFRLPIAVVSSFMLIFSYPHLVVSRLAYEITAFIFFEILSLIFFYLAYRTNKARYFVGIGLALGAGVYTYVGFRTFALCILLAAFLLLGKKVQTYRNQLLKIGLIFAALFISTTPFLSYGISHRDSVLARTRALSVFGQNLPPDEISKEIQGSVLRLSHLFFFDGDPNPRQNPLGVSVFDTVTLIFSVIGLLALAKRQRSLFFISFFLCLPAVINDIFSLERIPEFHYYGLGHPNTFRIAGLIPIIYFWLAEGIDRLQSLSMKISKYAPVISGVIVGSIVIINWHNYFDQFSLKPAFYLYNYEYNGQRMLNIARRINESSAAEVQLSPSFVSDIRISYFTRKNVAVFSFMPNSEKDVLRSLT